MCHEEINQDGEEKSEFKCASLYEALKGHFSLKEVKTSQFGHSVLSDSL